MAPCRSAIRTACSVVMAVFTDRYRRRWQERHSVYPIFNNSRETELALEKSMLPNRPIVHRLGFVFSVLVPTSVSIAWLAGLARPASGCAAGAKASGRIAIQIAQALRSLLEREQEPFAVNQAAPPDRPSFAIATDGSYALALAEDT